MKYLPKRPLKMIFVFQSWDMLVFQEGMHTYPIHVGCFSQVSPGTNDESHFLAHE